MKLILKAPVRHVTGKTKHAIAMLLEGRPVPLSPLPAPAWVGIATEHGGFYLLHFDINGA